MAENGAIYARKVIARLLNLSEKRIRQLTSEGIFQEYSPGYYRLIPTIQGYIKYLHSQIADDDQGSDYNTEKAKLTRAKREEAELELKLKKNELHKSADVEFIMTNMLIAFRSKLEILPYRVLPEIISAAEADEKDKRILDILKAAMDEALNELAEYNPESFDPENYLARLDDSVEQKSTANQRDESDQRDESNQSAEPDQRDRVTLTVQSNSTPEEGNT